MNIRDHCEFVRARLLDIESEVRVLMSSTGSAGEMFENAKLALRAIEDGRMRLGKVIQHHDGGVSVYDEPAPHLPLPVGSETHPIEKTADGEAAAPFMRPEMPGQPPQPAPPTPLNIPAPLAVPQSPALSPAMDTGPMPGASSPAPAAAVQNPEPIKVEPAATDWENLEDMASAPVTMNPHNAPDAATDEPPPPLPDAPAPDEHEKSQNEVEQSTEEHPMPLSRHEDKESDVNA